MFLVICYKYAQNRGSIPIDNPCIRGMIFSTGTYIIRPATKAWYQGGTTMDRLAVKAFYIDQLEHDFLPYWSKYVDHDHGGILNCINNYGDQLLAEDKFTWSQGRWLWVLSKVYELQQKGEMNAIPMDALKLWMEGTWAFLTEHCIDEENVCCFVLTRQGEKKKDARTGRYDASIYADCFALIGMSAYVKAVGCREQCGAVEALYRSIRRRVESGDFLTEPYPVPEGFCTHGIPMILLNSVHEYIRMKQSLEMDVQDEVAYARSKLEFILTELYDGAGHILEYKKIGAATPQTLLERHLKPGHTLEDAWFWVEFLEEFGGLEEYLPKIEKIVKATFTDGWDKEQGGMYCFVDYRGGTPRGERFGGAQEQLIVDTWDTKLWWVHSELLYVFLKMYQVTGNETYLKNYQTCADYAFSVFPNRETGEWIQIRRRDGTPENKVVALPVKDPFHIMRNFIKIVELMM